MSESEIQPVDTGMILRRAIELDEVSWELVSDEPLDSQSLAEIAAELGVSPNAVASALAEAKAGAPSRRSVLDRVVGPRRVAANRVVVTDDESVRERLVEWLSVTHGLKPRVRPDGVVIAHKRRDLAGLVGKGLRRAQGLGGLTVADTVQAATVATGDDAEEVDRSSLCLVADVGSKRKEAIAGGSAVAVGMSVVVGFAAVITGPVTLVGVPVAAGVGTLVARRVHRTTVVRLSESVSHTVDGVSQGEEPPRPVGSLSRRRTDRD